MIIILSVDRYTPVKILYMLIHLIFVCKYNAVISIYQIYVNIDIIKIEVNKKKEINI